MRFFQYHKLSSLLRQAATFLFDANENIRAKSSLELPKVLRGSDVTA
jgi:hypothetical protein